MYDSLQRQKEELKTEIYEEFTEMRNIFKDKIDIKAGQIDIR